MIRDAEPAPAFNPISVDVELEIHRQAAVAFLGEFALQSASQDQLISLLVDACADLLPADFVKVLELLPGDHELLLRAGVGWKDGIVGRATVPNDAGSQAGFTLLQDVPVLVDDLKHETRFTAPQLLTDHEVRSGISVVILENGRPFGVLAVHSRTPGAFEESDTQFLKSLANVLGSAFLKNKIENVSAALAEVSRVATSSTELSDVYDKLAQSIGRLIPCDRMVVSLIDGDEAYDAYVTGTDIPEYQPGARYDIQESGAASFGSSRLPLVIEHPQGESLERKSVERARAAGLLSTLMAPLIWNGKIIGSLHISSEHSEIYSLHEIEIAARIADQIAGAVANAQAYEVLKRESQVRETLSDIGKLVSSSLDFQAVAAGLPDLLRSIFRFDGLLINQVDLDSETITNIFQEGTCETSDPTRNTGSLAGTLTEQIISTGVGFLLKVGSPDDVIKRYPRTSVAIARGTRAFLSAPLVIKGRPIGTFQLRSPDIGAFSDEDVGIAERVARQMAGALANSLLVSDMSVAQWRLGERLKELACLYGVVDLLRDDAPIEVVARDIVKLIPPGWQYPEDTVACVTFDQQRFQTEGFVSTDWKLESDIVVNGQARGCIEVCYTESKPAADEGPFLAEERALIDRIAGLLADAIESRTAGERVRLQGAAVDASVDAIIAANRSGEIVLANPAAAEMFGCVTGTDLIGTSIVELMPEKYRAEHLAGLDRVNRGETPIHLGGTLEVEGLKANGQVFPLEISINKLNGSGKAAYVAVLRDITERRENERESRLRSAALGAAADMIVITDSNGVIEYVNNAFTRETGYTPAEVVGVNPRTLKSGMQDPIFYKQLWKTITAGRVWNGELINRRKNGSFYTEEMTITPIVEDDGRISNYVAIKRDISERKRSEKELVRLATTDTLTGLLNRHQFNVSLDQAVTLLKRRDGEGALITMDLDGFKYVNDTYGHNAGDELLALIARDLQQRLRASDVIARIGGDEFAAILHDASPDDALDIAEELVALIAECRLEIDGQQVSVTASAGVATFPDNDASSADLMAFSDIALYAAKDTGHDRAVLYSDLDEGRDTISSLQRARVMIADALQHDRIEIYWQPIFDATNLMPYEYEILARLKDGDGVIRPPADFIPQAEALDLMDDIDRRVIELALRAGADHHRHGQMIRLAVNISARSMNNEMADHIFHTAVETGYPLSYLTIEITETAVLSVNSESKAAVSRLVEAGISLSMDDFGSGATSFGNLESLPFSYMKLDGVYVQDLATSKRGRELVTGLTQLAHTLGMEVVAEYVQDDETVEFLREIGVEYLQGFHLAEPEPVPAQLASVAADNVR